MIYKHGTWTCSSRPLGRKKVFFLDQEAEKPTHAASVAFEN